MKRETRNAKLETMVDPASRTATTTDPVNDARFEVLRRLLSGRVQQYLLWTIIDTGCFLMANGLTAALLGTAPMWGSWVTLAIMLAVRLLVFWSAGLYRAMVRFTGTHALVVLVVGIILGTAASVVISHILKEPIHSYQFLVVEAMSALFLCGGVRLGIRLVLEWSPSTHKQRVLVYGAGSMGEVVHRELQRQGGHRIVGYLDDDPDKAGAGIHGAPVLGDREKLKEAVAATKPDLLVMAIQDLPLEVTRQVFSECMDLGLRVMMAKGFVTALDEGAPGVRDLAMEDMLSRPSRKLDPAPVRQALHGKRVLITGAGGSIGSELCRQVAAMGPETLLLLDHSEFNLYAIEVQIREKFPYLKIIPVMDDLQDRPGLERLFRQHRPQVVFHAAAYKHVPLVEENPFPGVRKNVRGFRNLLETAVANQVERLLLISTDKAVRPTNLMGCSKRTCELLLQTHATTTTKLCAVRFGNVLGSSGSVLPRFLDQIAKGGPVTVTHPEITRFFMLIPEAVALVLQSGTLAEHGEIFILDMGEPVKIADMARQLIFMTGHRPDVDIKIAYTGLRPGEKLYEELLLDDKEKGTAIEGILVAKPTGKNQAEVDRDVDDLIAACDAGDLHRLAQAMQRLVPEWVPDQRLYGSGSVPVLTATNAKT